MKQVNTEFLNDVPSSSESNSATPKICQKCFPGLDALKEPFSLITHNSEILKQRVRAGSDKTCKNINDQNIFIRQHIFDSCGNYIFCLKCISVAFNIADKRITRLHKIAKELVHESLLEVQKRNLTPLQQQNLILPEDESSVSEYLESLNDEDIVLVANKPNHGLTGKPSNFAKVEAKKQFSAFIDAHSTPSGRPKDSAGAQFYFLANFTHLYPSKKIKDQDSLEEICLLSAFNKAQTLTESQTISAGTMCNWLKECFPQHKLFPHKSDYCDMCAEMIVEKQSKERSISQAKVSNPASVKQLTKELENIKANMIDHEYSECLPSIFRIFGGYREFLGHSLG